MSQSQKEAKERQKELEFEKDLINFITSGEFVGLNDNELSKILVERHRWIYEKKIKTTKALWDNFRQILYEHNQDILKEPLSDTEFAQVKRIIEDLHTPYEAGQFLYGINGISQVEIDLDNGRHVYLTVFDQKQVGAGNTVYQVVTQIERPSKISGRENRRFDTTLLINGLPIIQIEEKIDGDKINEALNQMQQYIEERQYTDIFSTLQILVAMTPNCIKYMANTTAEDFNSDFAFEWQNPKTNKTVYRWEEFANFFLTIPMAHKMATSYMILDGTKNRQSLKVMRPYQVYATNAVLEAVKQADFELPINKLGYIWHTTGSGKTITSFKTAWLASRLPQVDKVVFVVDRIALTKQTESSYKAYDPEGSIEVEGRYIDAVSGTENTRALRRKLNEKGNGIIVTSVQKLIHLVKQKNFKVPNKHFVFIVDEAHRSTGGDSFKKLQEAFTGAAWVGYTGTPMFDAKGNVSKNLTKDIFGFLLHAYTIREAIADKNVLGFKVDFETTIPEEAIKDTYLPAFYKQKHPNWTDGDIQEKINHLTPQDMDDAIEPSFYDNNLDHVKLVVEDIFKHWRNRSNQGAYNAMLTTHVGGNAASTPMAMMYFDEFERVNQERAKEGNPTLKVGITFSKLTNNSDNQLEANNGLWRAMQHHNHLFGTQFGLDDTEGYMQDVIMRLNRTAKDKQYLDLVIVVDQLLTGFDAPQLNTLYVDRTLQNAQLIQAYSRTNRIADNLSKPWGRIVNYRWPKHNEELMNKALAIYANRDSANEQELIDTLVEDKILAKPFKEQLDEVKEIVKQLADVTDNFTEVPPSERKQEKMLHLMRQYSSGMAKLKQYDSTILDGDTIGFDYDDPDALVRALGMEPDQERLLTTTLYNQLKERLAEEKKVPVIQIELKMTHVKDIDVNYDYLTDLLEDLVNAVYEERMQEAKQVKKQINDFALSLLNRRFAQKVNKAADAIYTGNYQVNKGQKGKISILSGNALVEEISKQVAEDKITAFRNKWGIADSISSEELVHLFSYHIEGRRDLDNAGRISQLKREARAVYQIKAQDKHIAGFNKIKYGNELVDAIYNLADAYINEQ